MNDRPGALVGNVKSPKDKQRRRLAACLIAVDKNLTVGLQQARQALREYFQLFGEAKESMNAAGVSYQVPAGEPLHIDVPIETPLGSLLMTTGLVLNGTAVCASLRFTDEIKIDGGIKTRFLNSAVLRHEGVWVDGNGFAIGDEFGRRNIHVVRNSILSAMARKLYLDDAASVGKDRCAEE